MAKTGDKKKAPNKPGRPLRWESAEDMQKAIDAYFARQDEQSRPYTVTGLALALDMDRDRLIQYENREPFYDAIKKAKRMCQEYAEERLFSNAVAGVIFNLKNNHGWRDEQHKVVDQQTTIKGLPAELAEMIGLNDQD